MNHALKGKTWVWIIALLAMVLCLGATLVLAGSGMVFLATTGSAGRGDLAERPTVRPVATVKPLTPTPTDTPSPTPTLTPLPTDTPTATPTATEIPSPTPSPTETAIPTETPAPTATPAPPTATPPPTETPTPLPPQYPFIIKELDNFGTNHHNFDVYVAVVDKNNHPLGDYRLVGTHSSGIQVESRPSANDWTENSGAMHYKGGNIKYEAFNSPSGVWTLQLLDPGGAPVAPPTDFPFDAANPSWYFIIFERQ